METLFKKLKITFPKAIVQYDKNYMSFTFGGGLYYQLRVQKDKVRMMATNYPAKAKLGECLKLIKKHGIEGKKINDKEILFEAGVRNPEIFTLRLEIPYSGAQLDNDKFINDVIDSSAKFHEAVLPLVNHFMKEPVGDLYALMGGKAGVVSSAIPSPNSVKPQATKPSSSKDSMQQQLATVIVEKFPDAVIKKIDIDNYLDIHIPSVYPKKGTHIGINTAKGLIKIVFYCREESFNEQVLANSEKIEAYSQGLRIKDNPTFSDVSKASEAAIKFIEEIKRASSTASQSVSKSPTKSTPRPQNKTLSVSTTKTNKTASPTKSEESETDFQKMIKAYKDGDLEKVAELVEKGNPPLQFNMDQSVIENELISVCAAQEVDLNALKRIIKRGDDLNARNIDSDKYTAVHYCAWDGKTEALSLLLQSGALPDIVGEDGRTPLHLAVALGHTGVVKILLSEGVDSRRMIPDGNKFYGKDGGTALREALINQRWEIIDLLLEAGGGAEIIELAEPCVESYKGKNDLFDVIRLLAADGEYQNGNFDQDKLNELENRVKARENELESVANSLVEVWLKEKEESKLNEEVEAQEENEAEDQKIDYFELLKRNQDRNTEALTKAMLGDIEEESLDDEEDDEEEVENKDEDDELGFPAISYRIPSEDLKDIASLYLKQWQMPSTVYAWRMGISAYIPEFVQDLVSDNVCPVFTNEQIATIYDKIWTDRVIPILDYAPSELLSHTKRVWWIVPFCIIKEDVASMVFIDKDGFYAGIMNADIRMIFPWDKVDKLDFEYMVEDDPYVCRLTLYQENGEYLTFDEFYCDDEDQDHGSYLRIIEAIWYARYATIQASRGKSIWLEGEGGETFKVYEAPSELYEEDGNDFQAEEKPDEKIDDDEDKADVASDNEAEANDNRFELSSFEFVEYLENYKQKQREKASEDQGQTDESEKTNDAFYVDQSYQSEYLRFQEIADKTGILINQIEKEPTPQERDELWDIVQVFADRIYQLDGENYRDKQELNTLCYYAIVALHWCDIYVTDKRFSYTNGRFRRDTIALALCFYARIDRSYDYYDHIKLQFIMPHLQFSVLLWSINSIVNLGQDNLFGMFTADQAKKAQELFIELDNKNKASGGYGVVSPSKMTDNHPLKRIWEELFTLFSNVRIPYQFIKSYISLELPKRSFLEGLLTGKANNNPGVNVTLLDRDKLQNLTYLEKQIVHQQFPASWGFNEDLALVYIYFATTTDGVLSDEEEETIIKSIGEWISEEDEKKLNQIVREAFDIAKVEFQKDRSELRFAFAVESIRRTFYVNYDYDQERTHIQLLNVFKDLLYVAWADEVVKNAEIDLLKLLMNEWNIDKSELENENLSFFDDDTDEKIDTYAASDGTQVFVSRKEVLSDDEIQSFVQNKDAFLLLGSLTQITDKQAAILSAHQGGVYLDGLSSLTDKQYSFLSKIKGPLSFDGITTLSDKQASFLSRHQGKLNLDGLVSISDNQAEFLSKNQGSLSLNSLTLLSDQQAFYLSKIKGDLSLNGLEVLTDKQAESFSQHEGELSLDGVNKLTDKQAAFLAQHKGDLFLDSLEKLTDKQALTLSTHRGTLTLNGLKSLSVVSARALSDREGDICLDGLTSMTKEMVSLFSKHKGGYLSLSGIETLDDNSLIMLAKHEGGLYLNQIPVISDPVAVAFSKHEGDLYLNGVTTLTDKAAIALSKHEGQLSMDGLTSLSEVAAEALAIKGIEISEDEDSQVQIEEEDEQDENVVEQEHINEKISQFICDNVWERGDYGLDKKPFPDVIQSKKDLDLLFRKFSAYEVDLIVNKIQKTKTYILLPFVKEILSREMDLSSFKPPFWFIPIVAYGNNISSILYFNQDGIYNTFKNDWSLSMVAHVDLWKDISVEPGYNGLFDDNSDDELLSSLKIEWYNPKTGNSGETNIVEFHGEQYGASLKILQAIWDFAWKDVVDRSRGANQFLLGPPPFLKSFDNWEQLLDWAKHK